MSFLKVLISSVKSHQSAVNGTLSSQKERLAVALSNAVSKHQLTELSAAHISAKAATVAKVLSLTNAGPGKYIF